MTPSPHICRALSGFGKLRDNELGLTETALILAAAERPGCDLGPYERHLEKLTDDVAAYAGRDAERPRRGLAMRAEALRQVIARRYGYGGCDEAYEEVEFGNLIRVIDRRQGLPEILGIIYLHVARALGWHMDGLDFPPRLLVRLEFAGQRMILDPFDGGIVRQPQDLRDLYKAVSGSHVELSPRHTAALDNRTLLIRSRKNAKVLALRNENLEGALDEVRTLLLFAPDQATLWREAGILNARLDHLDEAISALEEFLRRSGTDASHYRTSILLQELRSRLG
ncbi:MAG TPA: tetratricopeptide repeat protein [Rhodospirillales bacterium]|nr:tetratricopeptide repeat protein [Rhodospirillales bacterium]